MNTTVDNSARPIKTRRIKFRYPHGLVESPLCAG